MTEEGADEGADEGVGFESSGCCTPLGAGTGARVGLGLLSEAKTCGRHLARCFVVGALASSSEIHTLAKGAKGPMPENLQFRHRSSSASMAISRAGGFIRIK